MKTVFITGADRGVGLALCRTFLEHDFTVFAGQFMPEWTELSALKEEYPELLLTVPLDVGNTESVKAAAESVARRCKTLDILVNCAGIVQPEGEKGLRAAINVNAVGALRMTECFLPLMEGGMKRLCYVSSEAGSVTLLHRDSGYSYSVSKTVLNMEVKLMFNELRPRGYTFRLYHPGWVRTYMSGQKATQGNFEPEETAVAAYEQFVSERDWEDVLLMTDVKGEAWPF